MKRVKARIAAILVLAMLYSVMLIVYGPVLSSGVMVAALIMGTYLVHRSKVLEKKEKKYADMDLIEYP